MINSLERRCQVRVEHPPPLRFRTPGDVDDRIDRVMIATARSEPVRLGFEASLPLRFQRVETTRPF
jgi:hypothetical protein